MITVYSKSNCIQCTQTQRLMDRLGLEYTKVDIELDDSNYELVRSMGYQVVPVVVVDDVSWSGFRPDRIKKLVRPTA